jgi:hypothetical protein
MQIVRDHLRFDSEQAAKMIDAIDVSPPGFVVFQIANVMRHKGTVALHQAKSAFQFGAAGKNRTAGTERHHERTRRVAAGPPNQILAPANQSNDGVIGADVNRSVVDQKAIRESAQSLGGVGVQVSDGFIGNVSTGEYERPGELRAQQMMDRRVRQHESDVAIGGSYRRRKICIRDAAQQHDRPPRTHYRLFFGPIDFG